MTVTSNEGAIEKMCYEYSHHWFLKNDVDQSELDGVSVGKIFQIWVFEKLFELSQVNADRFDLRSLLKRLNLEWTVRSLLGVFSRDRDKAQVDYLLVFDVNNDPMINALNAIGKGLGARSYSVSAVTIDSAISRKCKIPNKLSWFGFFSFSRFFLAIRNYFAFYSERMPELTFCVKSIRQRFGIKKARSVKRYFSVQALQLSFEIQALRALLIAKKPKVVILASDAHRVSRATVLLCKLLGIKTVVYQHGATIWEYGYVPVFADCMLVWGGASRRWFQQHGVPASKLVEVGNLQADMQLIPQLQPADFQRDRKLFFFPNPIDRDVTRNVLLAFIDLCSRFSFEGVVKLHPSERNIDFFESVIADSNSGVVISQASMADAGIQPGDIAVVVNSTAGIDCCFYGAYVLNFAVDSMPNPVDYEGGGVGIRSGLNDYVEKFERLLLLPVNDYIVSRSNFIRDHLGPLDGKALQRACEQILKY